MFCWSESEAMHIDIALSLLVTSRLHDVDPYDYLVSASRVGQLTQRV